MLHINMYVHTYTNVYGYDFIKAFKILLNTTNNSNTYQV